MDQCQIRALSLQLVLEFQKLSLDDNFTGSSILELATKFYRFISEDI